VKVKKILIKNNILSDFRKLSFSFAGLLIIFSLSLSTLLKPTKKYKTGFSEIKVVGHAGSGFLYPFYPFNPLPANSLASIIKAIEKHGADGVELDVQLSKDGVPILYHDYALESMTDASGLIEERNAADIIGLKYNGGLFYDIFHNENVISLEQALKHFRSYSQLPYLQIDLRNSDPDRNSFYAQTIIRLLKKYNYPFQKIDFISSDPTLLEAFRDVEPQSTLILDMDESYRITLDLAVKYGLHGICANSKKITQEQVREIKGKGLLVILFGGKSHTGIESMLQLRPDIIQVNNLRAANDLLK
jgi:glycerophosphoryl diester phosphodiesterase